MRFSVIFAESNTYYLFSISNNFMKNLLLSMVILGFLVLGCRNSPSSSSDGGPVAISLPETEVDSVQVILDGNYCYRYMIHRDTYDIHLTLSQGSSKGGDEFR